ncbi:ABC transporter permease [Sedimentibacter sp. zth1]|uniref:ABC transporter permease n=1 Tax=Sedimentibacter sp. zth1 TaxID=2816908 RepID=UPI001A9283E8|nr:ABC transporter permease [Sedimentibacter sp. zth1]QSX05359.1 ABC transporter permease [Sedimentibacter sp. zth1]
MLKRILYSLLTLLLVSLIIFTIFQCIPGDPILSKLGEEYDPTLEAVLREEFGLDKPVVERYFSWINGLLHFDMGKSIKYNLPVNKLILDRLPNTLGLTIMSFVFVILIGIPLGIFIAKYNKSNSNRGVVFNILTQLGIAIPSFFFAMILIIIFCIKLKIFEVSAFRPISQGFGVFIKGLVLPSIAISVSAISITIRYVRNSVVEQLSSDYVLSAKNKGVKENRILFKHVLRNSMIPIVTILGMLFVNIITGSIVVEAVFSIPGIGSLLTAAIKSKDLPLTQGICVYISFVVVFVFLILDILYRIIDPRIRVKE